MEVYRSQFCSTRNLKKGYGKCNINDSFYMRETVSFPKCHQKITYVCIYICALPNKTNNLTYNFTSIPYYTIMQPPINDANVSKNIKNKVNPHQESEDKQIRPTDIRSLTLQKNPKCHRTPSSQMNNSCNSLFAITNLQLFILLFGGHGHIFNEIIF